MNKNTHAILETPGGFEVIELDTITTVWASDCELHRMTTASSDKVITNTYPSDADAKAALQKLQWAFENATR